MSLLRRFPLAAYFLLAYLLTWGIEIPGLLRARGMVAVQLPEWLEALSAFGPMLAALLVLWLVGDTRGIRRLLASLGRWRVSWLWLAATLLMPVGLMVAALLISSDLQQLASGELIGRLWSAGRLSELIVLGGLVQGLGEEPGWRGYALPALRSKWGPLAATLILWPIWTCWHLPVFLLRPEFSPGALIGFSLGILFGRCLVDALV